MVVEINRCWKNTEFAFDQIVVILALNYQKKKFRNASNFINFISSLNFFFWGIILQIFERHLIWKIFKNISSLIKRKAKAINCWSPFVVDSIISDGATQCIGLLKTLSLASGSVIRSSSCSMFDPWQMRIFLNYLYLNITISFAKLCNSALFFSKALIVSG